MPKMLQRRRLFVIISLLFLWFTVSSFSALERETETFLNNGDYSKAYNSLLDKISKDPDNPDGLFYLGVSAGSGDMSSLYLKDYIQKYPEGEHTSAARGLLMDYYSAAGMLITAGKLFAGQEHDSFASREVNYKIALYKQQLGEYQQAVDLYKSVCENEKDEICAWAGLGLADCLFLTEEYDKALSRYKSLVDKSHDSPIFPFALIGISETYRRLGNIDKAGTFYELYRERFEHAPANHEIEAAILEGKTSNNNHKLQSLINVDYYIQVGVFARRSNADVCLKKFRNMRYKSRMISFRENGKTFYKVILGPYASESKVRKEKIDLERSQGEIYTIFIQ